MNTIPIFYDPRQDAAANISFSPSAGKPALAVASWQRLGLPVEVRSFEPCTLDLLRRVHLSEYVDGVMEGRRRNGFGNRMPEVAASLPWTTGSMLAAAREALANGRVACSPTSGFHHAQPGRGSQFCTFNGLVVTALALREEGLADRVGILDLDAHYGDGTDACLLRMPDLAAHVEHWTFGRDVPSLKREGIEAWMRDLPAIVDAMAVRCGVVLYQAGADPHEDDPFGGWMTSEEMRLRDRIVFEGLARRGVPVAWNLAGGYQEPVAEVLRLHDATMEECCDLYAWQV